jgi:DNA-binding transcriptional LysR family regulator
MLDVCGAAVCVTMPVNSGAGCLRPDLASLDLFLHAVESRSLSRAAEQCHIALAAASRRIALLEDSLGVALLDRSSRGVQPTPAGLALVSHARQVLQQVGQLKAELSEYAKGVKGTVRLHCSTSALTQFLPEQLATFSSRFPEIRLEIQERRSGEIARAVISGEADVGIIVKGPPAEGLEVFLYSRDHLVAVLPKTHPLRRRRVAFADLLDSDFACLDSNTSITRELVSAANAANRPLKLRVQVWSFEAMCRMVQAGFGIGVLPHSAAETFAKPFALRLVPLADAWAVREHLICVRQLASLPVHARRLVEHLRASG